MGSNINGVGGGTTGGTPGATTVYQTATISAGAATLNASTAGYWGVILNQNITTLTLTGAVPGNGTVMDVIFTQPPAGGATVAMPANTQLNQGSTALVSTVPSAVTLVRFTSVDGGATWIAVRLGVFNGAATIARPSIPDDNSTFNDEATSTAPWTVSGGTAAVTSSVLRLTKTVAPGTGASITRTVTMPAAGKDWILYGKAKASNAGFAFWLENAAADKINAIWLNATDMGIFASGQISVTGWNGATRTGATLATGIDTTANMLDFALQYDSKWLTLSVFFREADGRWQFKGRVACTDITPVRIVARSLSSEAIGAWVEFDFLTVCRPNVIVIGDSHAEGKTLYSPNLSLGLTNYESSWQRHAPIYPNLRNNLIVNKAVGGETSTATLARYSDATGQSARVIFLHASSNDYVGGVSLSTRTSNTASMVTAGSSSGAQTVLLNALYAASASIYNPANRDYCKTWWDTSAATVGAFSLINIMIPVMDNNGYVQSALVQADYVHLTPTGYAAVGAYISS